MSHTTITISGNDSAAKIEDVIKFLQILARIPEDTGKIIHVGHSQSMPVGPALCEGNDCLYEGIETPAVVVVKGETDSFGFEPVHFCLSCLLKAEHERDVELNAVDVEDLRAPEGMCWFFCAGTNIDSSHSWCTYSTSFREITKVFRRADAKAAAYAGLWPRNAEPELMPLEEAKARYQRVRAAEQRDYEEAMGYYYRDDDDDEPEAEYDPYDEPSAESDRLWDEYEKQFCQE